MFALEFEHEIPQEFRLATKFGAYLGRPEELVRLCFLHLRDAVSHELDALGAEVNATERVREGEAVGGVGNGEASDERRRAARDECLNLSSVVWRKKWRVCRSAGHFCH